MRIILRELNMTYPNGKKASQGANAFLDSPSLIGLLGSNDVGKPTLMKLLMAGLLPTGGVIRADGESLTKCERAYKACLNYLSRNFGLLDELTVEQFLDYIGALKGLRNGWENIQAVIEVVHLGEKRRTRIRTLSGDQRQRVDTAQALLGDPVFLIFDKPMVSLDSEECIRFRNLFSRLAQGRLMLLSIHIIEDMRSTYSRLLVLHQGRSRFDDTLKELIRAAEDHIDTFEARARGREDDLRTTARVNTARGVVCRAVMETLPPYVWPVELTLENAYLYLILGEDEV